MFFMFTAKVMFFLLRAAGYYNFFLILSLKNKKSL